MRVRLAAAIRFIPVLVLPVLALALAPALGAAAPAAANGAAAAGPAAGGAANGALLDPVALWHPATPFKGSDTKLPIPRFISLLTDDVNMRVGPGFQYPIEWTYRRRGLPVEVEREFDVWRLVLAPDGGRGWVHEATVSGVRSFVVTGGARILRQKPDDKAAAVAVLQMGVIGVIRRCQAGDDWCEVAVDGQRGFLRRVDFWGTFPGEAVP